MTAQLLPLLIKLRFTPGLAWTLEVSRTHLLQGDMLRAPLRALGFDFRATPPTWVTMGSAAHVTARLSEVLHLCADMGVQVDAQSTPLAGKLLRDTQTVHDLAGAHDLTGGHDLLNLQAGNLCPAAVLAEVPEEALTLAVAQRPFEHLRVPHLQAEEVTVLARDLWTAWDFAYRVTVGYALRETADAEVHQPEFIRHLFRVCGELHPEFTPERLRGLRVTDGQRPAMRQFFGALEELGMLA